MKYHLPGLPKEYLELFFATSNRIEQLWQKMDRVKLDMNEINAANNVIEEDVEKLDIFTEQIVDNAQLTEYMILMRAVTVYHILKSEQRWSCA